MPSILKWRHVILICTPSRFLPVNKDAETSLRLIIRPTSESEEHLTGAMKLCSELDGATLPDDVCIAMYV